MFLICLIDIKVCGQNGNIYYNESSFLSIEKYTSGSSSFDTSYEFRVGNYDGSDRIYRGFLQFDFSDISKYAIIDEAILTIKCLDYTGKTFAKDKGVLNVRVLSYEGGTSAVDLWRQIASAPVAKSINILTNTTCSIDLKSNLQNIVKGGSKTIFLGLTVNNESVDGFNFSRSSSSHIMLNVKWHLPVPSVPSNLKASNVESNGCSLEWSASSSAEWYNVYKDGSFFKQVKTTKVDVQGLKSNTKYSFSVSGHNSFGGSKSSTISVLTNVISPSNLTATKVNCNRYNLNWNGDRGNGVKYEIYRNNLLYLTVEDTLSCNIDVSDLVGGLISRLTIKALGVSSVASCLNAVDVKIDNGKPSATTYCAVRLPMEGYVLNWNNVIPKPDYFYLVEHNLGIGLTYTSSINSIWLKDLLPEKVYIFSIYSVIDGCFSDPYTIGFKTGSLKSSVIDSYDGEVVHWLDLEEFSVEVYPNPADEVLNVKGLLKFSYDIIDISGRIVISGNTLDSTIDIASLRPGSYILRIVKDDEVLSMKFIKRK